jgi:hypothetical protein
MTEQETDLVRRLGKIVADQLEELDRLRQFVADTCAGFACLPECDSATHAELCPVGNPVEAWRQMRAERDRLRAGVTQARELRDTFEEMRINTGRLNSEQVRVCDKILKGFE